MLVKLSKDNFWIITVDNLIQECIEFRAWKKDLWKDRNTRDNQMAINLKWLTQIKYPNEKIIVWAHNYHLSKYSGHYPKKFLNYARTMGSILTEDPIFRDSTYVIGFTSYNGTAGRNLEKKYKVQKAKAESFERWINNEYKYSFIDFKNFNNIHPLTNDVFYMKCSMTAPYHRNEEAPWTRIFDGVFYVKNTYPCE